MCNEGHVPDHQGEKDYPQFKSIGPSMLRAPADQTKVATVFGNYSCFLFLPPLFKTTEGVVVLFQIFACGPKLPIE